MDPTKFNYDCSLLITPVSGGSGVLVCGQSYQCGVADGVCPSDFSSVGVSCSVCDSDCNYGGTNGATSCNNQPSDGSGICTASCQLKPPVISVSVSATCIPPGWTTTAATATVQCSSNTGAACADGSGGTSDTLRLLVSSSQISSCSNTYSSYTLTNPQSISSQSWVCGAGQNTAGATDYSDVPVQCNVDAIAPTVSIGGAPATWTQFDQTATVDCTDAGGSNCNAATYKYILYLGGPPPGNVCPTTESLYASGSSVVIYDYMWVCGFGRDVAGNQAVSAPTEFKVDKDITSVSASHSPSTVTTSTQVTITSTATDDKSGLAKIEVYMDNILRATCTAAPVSPCSWTSGSGLSIGSHNYYARATDNAGNTRNSAAGTFNVISAPAVTASHSPASPKTSDTVTITATATAQTGATISSMRIFADGVQKTPINCNNLGTATATCTYSQTYSYNAPASPHTYYADATDSNAQTGTSATQTFSVNDAPTTQAAGFTGSCVQGQTITVQCGAADINQNDNALDARLWLGTCTAGSCSSTANWVHLNNVTMTAPAALDGQPFTRSFTITDPAGTLIAATCLADDEKHYASNWGDAYPLCTVGQCSGPTFSNINAAPNPAKAGSVTITFTSSAALAGNPSVNVIPGANLGQTTKYPAAYASNSGNSYTYTFTVDPAHTTGRADIEITGTSATCSNSGTSLGSFSIDNAAPVTSIACNSGSCGRVFVNQPVIVTLTCSDNGAAGCDTITYSLDGGSQQAVKGSTATIPVSGVGTHTVNYFSNDTLNNIESQKSRSFPIYRPSEVQVRATVSVSSGTVNYGTPVQGIISGAFYRVSDGVKLADLDPNSALVTEVNITSTSTGNHDYFAENTNPATGTAYTPNSFTQQAYQAATGSWDFVIDTTRYHSDVAACVQSTETGQKDCDSASFNVNGAPSIALSVVFPDLKNFVVPLAAGCGTNCPNFTKPMPVKFTAAGRASPSNAECTGANCVATYSIDSQPPVQLSYDGFERAFAAAPLSQALACGQTHLLTVDMTETSSGAAGQKQENFSISCDPAVTISPVEKRFALGDRNADAFNVTIWNPLGTTTFELKVDTKRPSDSFVLGFIDFQGDGDTLSGQTIPALSSQSYIVRLNSVGAGRSGSFALQFTATDEGDRTKQYFADASLLVFAEALPEFAAWQLAVAMVIGLFVFYRYGLNTARAKRRR